MTAQNGKQVTLQIPSPDEEMEVVIEALAQIAIVACSRLSRWALNKMRRKSS
jgi:hypothetical protein